MSNCKTLGFRPAIPTWYNGFLHDSKTEARVAEMLHKNGIEYLPHRTFEITMRDATVEEYTIDFVFTEPQKFIMISQPIIFLDVFGRPQPKHKVKMEAMEYTYDCYGFLANSSLIDQWWRCGMIGEPKTITGKPDR